jgi:uncharacterized protein YcfL
VYWGLLFNIQKGFSCIIQLHSSSCRTSESIHLYASEVLVMEQAQTETKNTTICSADLASVNYFQYGKSAIHPKVVTEICCLTQIFFFYLNGLLQASQTGTL